MMSMQKAIILAVLQLTVMLVFSASPAHAGRGIILAQTEPEIVPPHETPIEIPPPEEIPPEGPEPYTAPPEGPDQPIPDPMPDTDPQG